jgi:hypothetical protein
MSHFRKIIIIAALSMLSFLFAKPVEIWLDEIQIISEHDKMGDQLYFYVLENRKDQDLEDRTMPAFPFSYTKKNIKEFESVLLWRDEVAKNNQVDMTVSLLEREAPPWFQDDVMGIVSLNIKNDADKIKVKWKNEENCSIDSTSKSDVKKITIQRDAGQYKIKLRVVY